ncbi:Na+/H+ antiporter NhaA [Gymnodinialimonas sp.]
MYPVWNFITGYSVLLVLGAVVAVVWANVDAESYQYFTEFMIWQDAPIGVLVADGSGGAVRDLTLQYLVNDVLMALFFAIAAKEVWEAVILKNGALRGKKAATPLIATLGGILGPIAVYLGLAYFLGSSTYDALANGWAIPTATDIAFSYVVGRIVFGAGHPAVRFLLLLAIADDAAGLLILAVFYPEAAMTPSWLLLSAGAAVAVFVLANWLPRYLDRGDQLRRRSSWVRRKLSFWPYALAGCACWYGFQEAGLHPALGLLPIVLTIPHADRAFGIFSAAEVHLHDLLNTMGRALKFPVAITLGLFGLMNAGVAFSAMGEATWLVLAGLLIGKPLGIFVFGWIAARPLGLGLPLGMRMVDLLVIGIVAAIGFTVSLFVTSVAFEPGPIQDAARMGALLSFAAALIAVITGRVTKVQKQQI